METMIRIAPHSLPSIAVISKKIKTDSDFMRSPWCYPNYVYPNDKVLRDESEIEQFVIPKEYSYKKQPLIKVPKQNLKKAQPPEKILICA